MNTNYYAPVKILNQDKIFADVNFLKNITLESNKLIHDKSVLSDEIINFFGDINVIPKFVIVFAKNSNHGDAERRWIHNDIYFTDSHKLKPVHCGINWEVSDHIVSEFHWYDMADIPKCRPPSELDEKYYPFSGVHYVKPGNNGVPEKATLLCKTNIVGPTLVRTDIPHLVAFKPKQIPYDGLRISVSIRFEETWKSWHECLEIFKPIIVSN